MAHAAGATPIEIRDPLIRIAGSPVEVGEAAMETGEAVMETGEAEGRALPDLRRPQ